MNYEHLLIEFLTEHSDGIQEYELLAYIEKNHPAFFSFEEPFSLFKKHFYLFHQLYKLNDSLLAQGQRLIISALDIRLCLIGDAENEIGRVDALKGFYLDETNLHLSETEIGEMMQLFWKKYMAVEEKAEALKILGLQNELELNKEIIKKRFNQLAKEHHPDRGGDELDFIKIKKSYDELKLLY